MFNHRKTSDKKVKLEKNELEIAGEALKTLAKGNFPDGAEIITPSDLHVEKICNKGNSLPSFVKEQLNKLNEYDHILQKTSLDKKKIEIAIRKKKVVEDAIISYLAEGLLVVDPNKKIVLINKRVKDMFGFPDKKNLHRSLYFKYLKFLNGKGELVSSTEDPIGFSLRTGREVNVLYIDNYFASKCDGSKTPITLTVTPLFINEVLKGVVAIFHDASREKKLDEVKSDFISIAAHQLRTPLAISTLHTELLLSGRVGPLSSEQERYIREIAFGNKKIAELLTNFLVASKAELGTLEIDERPVSIKNILEDVFLELKPRIIVKKLKETKELDENTITKTDPVLLRIVLQNIVANAVRYTPENGSIHATLEKTNDVIVFSMKDSGCGIPKEDQDRVFLRMYRGSNAKKQDSEGTGLGLYIAKSIIEKAGGSIWFESKEGEGSTFYVTIPIK